MKLSDAEPLVKAALELTQRAVARAAEITAKGTKIDDFQVLSSRVAYAATEARAAKELHDFTSGLGATSTPYLERLAIAGAAELARSARDRLLPCLEDLGMSEKDVEAIYTPAVRSALDHAGHER